MFTGSHLENLAQVVHADKQHAFAQERFARQIERAQGNTDTTLNPVAWWSKIRRMTARPIVITVAVRPLRLTVQWA
ncbi:MAG: hypothetical protein ACOYNY_03565 [Caldilineaceae bacterium]